jgi:hypothetical protein
MRRGKRIIEGSEYYQSILCAYMEISQ